MEYQEKDIAKTKEKAHQHSDELGQNLYLILGFANLIKKVFTKKTTIPYRDIGIICGALAYFLMPFDIIPDFLPGGLIDDLCVIILAYKTISDFTRNKI